MDWWGNCSARHLATPQPPRTEHTELDRRSGVAYDADMKFTGYFLHTHQRPDRQGIRLEWVERVVASPIREETQKDGRIRKWGRIPEAGGKYLRVVLLEDGETVHNAFFDRRFQEVSDESQVLP